MKKIKITEGKADGLVPVLETQSPFWTQRDESKGPSKAPVLDTPRRIEESFRMLESSPGNPFSQSFDDMQDLTDLCPQAHGMSTVPQGVEGAPGRAEGEEAHYQHSCSSDDIVFDGNDNHDEAGDKLIQRLHRQLAEAEERIKVLSEEVSVERLAQKKPQRAVDMALVLSPRTISTTDVEVLRQRVLQLQVENREREAEVDQLHLLLLELRPKLESEVRDQVADIISKAEKDAREIRLQADAVLLENHDKIENGRNMVALLQRRVEELENALEHRSLLAEAGASGAAHRSADAEGGGGVLHLPSCPPQRLLRKVPQSDADVLGSDGEWMIVRGDPQPHTRVPPASGKVKWPRLSLLAAAGALVIVAPLLYFWIKRGGAPGGPGPYVHRLYVPSDASVAASVAAPVAAVAAAPAATVAASPVASPLEPAEPAKGKFWLVNSVKSVFRIFRRSNKA